LPNFLEIYHKKIIWCEGAEPHSGAKVCGAEPGSRWCGTGKPVQVPTTEMNQHLLHLLDTLTSRQRRSECFTLRVKLQTATCLTTQRLRHSIMF